MRIEQSLDLPSEFVVRSACRVEEHRPLVGMVVFNSFVKNSLDTTVLEIHQCSSLARRSRKSEFRISKSHRTMVEKMRAKFAVAGKKESILRADSNDTFGEAATPTGRAREAGGNRASLALRVCVSRARAGYRQTQRRSQRPRESYDDCF